MFVWIASHKSAEPNTLALMMDFADRDALDSTRADSPLTEPEGAVLVDTSDLEIEEIVDRIVALLDSSDA